MATTSQVAGCWWGPPSRSRVRSMASHKLRSSASKRCVGPSASIDQQGPDPTGTRHCTPLPKDQPFDPYILLVGGSIYLTARSRGRADLCHAGSRDWTSMFAVGLLTAPMGASTLRCRPVTGGSHVNQVSL